MVIHKYTEEEKAFLAEFVPGHSYKEIAEEFNRRFLTTITEQEDLKKDIVPRTKELILKPLVEWVKLNIKKEICRIIPSL